MSIHLPTSKPRNPLATLARRRVAGRHQDTRMANRSFLKQDLKQLLKGRPEEHPR